MDNPCTVSENGGSNWGVNGGSNWGGRPLKYTREAGLFLWSIDQKHIKSLRKLGKYRTLNRRQVIEKYIEDMKNGITVPYVDDYLFSKLNPLILNGRLITCDQFDRLEELQLHQLADMFQIFDPNIEFDNIKLEEKKRIYNILDDSGVIEKKCIFNSQVVQFQGFTRGYTIDYSKTQGIIDGSARKVSEDLKSKAEQWTYVGRNFKKNNLVITTHKITDYFRSDSVDIIILPRFTTYSMGGVVDNKLIQYYTLLKDGGYIYWINGVKQIKHDHELKEMDPSYNTSLGDYITEVFNWFLKTYNFGSVTRVEGSLDIIIRKGDSRDLHGSLVESVSPSDLVESTSSRDPSERDVTEGEDMNITNTTDIAEATREREVIGDTEHDGDERVSGNRKSSRSRSSSPRSQGTSRVETLERARSSSPRARETERAQETSRVERARSSSPRAQGTRARSSSPRAQGTRARSSSPRAQGTRARSSSPGRTEREDRTRAALNDRTLPRNPYSDYVNARDEPVLEDIADDSPYNRGRSPPGQKLIAVPFESKQKRMLKGKTPKFDESHPFYSKEEEFDIKPGQDLLNLD
jgi:hypothetical protein